MRGHRERGRAGLMSKVAHIVAERVARLLLIVGFALALDACSKCDIPTWQHGDVGSAPLACHGNAPAQ